MTAGAHHLTAHWVDEDEGAGTLTHHHVHEVWVDEDEAPAATPDNQVPAEVAV
jgi:hypothetical protein